MASLVMEVPVLVAANTPMPMKKVEVADPAPHEVRVKMAASEGAISGERRNPAAAPASGRVRSGS